jgi:hypothetical protein
MVAASACAGKSELRAHLQRHSSLPYSRKLADFHLLLYLARQPNFEASGELRPPLPTPLPICWVFVPLRCGLARRWQGGREGLGNDLTPALDAPSPCRRRDDGGGRGRRRGGGGGIPPADRLACGVVVPYMRGCNASHASLRGRVAVPRGCSCRAAFEKAGTAWQSSTACPSQSQFPVGRTLLQQTKNAKKNTATNPPAADARDVIISATTEPTAPPGSNPSAAPAAGVAGLATAGSAAACRRGGTSSPATGPPC